MADCQTEILGKWTVRFKGREKSWTWEYVFSQDGTVTWRDPLNNLKGSGRWYKIGELVNIVWTGSNTKESWRCPIRTAGQTGWIEASYGIGNFSADRVVAAATPAGASDVNPSIAGVPWEKYVDQFTEVKYDVNYKIPPDKSFAFSSILELKYSDSTAIELDIEADFSSQPTTPQAARDAMARGTIGRGSRIFPAVLNERTVPRLWAAREDAFRAQEDSFNLFAGIALAGVAFVLSVPAMPAGPMGAGAGSTLRVTRRPVPGTRVPPAPIQNNMVRLGTPGQPGNLYSSVQSTSQGTVYRVEMIVLEGKGSGVAIARATHREMIRRAAQAASTAGQKQFKMVGKQANPNFARHADKLAQDIGVAGSGKRVGSGQLSDYEVILDVAKTLTLE